MQDCLAGTRVHTERNFSQLDEDSVSNDARNGRLFSRDCLPTQVAGVVNRRRKTSARISPLTSFTIVATTSLQEEGAKNRQKRRHTRTERRLFFSRRERAEARGRGED